MRSASDMSEYLLPPVERVIYGNAPLVEVICQVRFPVDLRIDTTPPADFQQRIRKHFPILTQQNRAVLQSMPEGFAKALEAVLPAVSSAAWQFATEDGSHALELVKDNLTFVSRAYRRWEDFRELFGVALSAFRSIYDPPFFTRVGLRYRDLIQRSKIGLSEAKWSELLSPGILGEMSQVGIEERVLEASRTLLLTLPALESKIRLQHGVTEIEASTETAYLIDCDFFTEKTDSKDADQALEYFHGNAARFFRWCITERLHQAMEPEPVSR